MIKFIIANNKLIKLGDTAQDGLKISKLYQLGESSGVYVNFENSSDYVFIPYHAISSIGYSKDD